MAKSAARATQGVRLTKLIQTCNACPSQWDAWAEDGTYYYIRFRHGYLSVNSGDVDGPEVFCYADDRMADGYMEAQEMLELTGMVFP